MTGPGLTCTSCLSVDGQGEGAEVDPASGLCLHCQPCPGCGRMGTGCTDTRCDPAARSDR